MHVYKVSLQVDVGFGNLEQVAAYSPVKYLVSVNYNLCTSDHREDT